MARPKMPILRLQHPGDGRHRSPPDPDPELHHLWADGGESAKLVIVSRVIDGIVIVSIVIVSIVLVSIDIVSTAIVSEAMVSNVIVSI